MNVKHCHRALPNFLMVGTSKAGTTSLYYYLQQHPDVFLSEVKEPCFIASRFIDYPTRGVNDEKFFNRHLVDSFDEYTGLFEPGRNKTAIGEASTNNLVYAKRAITEIKKYIGEPKIVIVLRNPVERAFSAYMMLVRDGRETLPFEEALAAEDNRIRDNWDHIWMYKREGMYFQNVSAYLDNFKHVKICLFDDLKTRPVSLVQELFRFLDVDAAFVPETRVRHNASGLPTNRRINEFFVKPTKLQAFLRTCGTTLIGQGRWAQLRDRTRARFLKKVHLEPDIRHRLIGYFEEDIYKVSRLISRDLSHWLQ